MQRFLAIPVLFSVTAAAALAAADNGLLALVPASAKVVSSIDVQQARSSPFGQFLLGKMDTNGHDFDQMSQETGFDPRRDLQSVVFASPGPAATPNQSSFVVLMRGTFDAQRIRSLILSKGGTAQSSGGVDVYVGEHGDKNAFALPDIGIAVMGDLASVQQVIANRANPTVLDPDLQSLISHVSAGNDAWFATILGGSYLAQHFNGAPNQSVKAPTQALQSVRRAAGGVQFGDTVQLSFDAFTRSPQDATSLADVVRFVTGMVQPQGQNAAHTDLLASALDNMTVNASGDHFHASLAIPEKSIEQLADSGLTPRAHRGFKSSTQQ